MDDLLRRMQGGDRQAVGEFIERYGAKLRRRIRGKLRQPTRRLFDSQEILSTISRRLDRYVMQGKFEVQALGQFWEMIFKITDNAVLEKSRLYHRLQSVEGSDSAFAQSWLYRLTAAEDRQPDGARIEFEAALHLLEDATDQQILSLWLGGEPYRGISCAVGRNEAFVRKRWERIKKKLRAGFESEAN